MPVSAKRGLAPHLRPVVMYLDGTEERCPVLS